MISLQSSKLLNTFWNSSSNPYLRYDLAATDDKDESITTLFQIQKILRRLFRTMDWFLLHWGVSGRGNLLNQRTIHESEIWKGTLEASPERTPASSKWWTTNPCSERTGPFLPLEYERIRFRCSASKRKRSQLLCLHHILLWLAHHQHRDTGIAVLKGTGYRRRRSRIHRRQTPCHQHEPMVYRERELFVPMEQ